MKIPFLDLKAQFNTIQGDIQSALNRVLDSQSFILGPEVDQFEKQVASYLGVPHAVGMASGSDALYLSLVALGVGPGDGVITTPFTFFATGGSIVRTGARPFFADIDPRTYNLDPGKIAELIETNRRNPRAKLKAIMPVHIFGQPAEMDAIQKIARTHGLTVVEDACQAIGANYRGKKVGTLSEFGCYSFFPSKNLGGFGDGGLAVTADQALAQRIRRLRVHG
ncbi:MAG: DegT/DnrJ/EryC1/StrS family aminotransferase, partial [bacterium]|nr:DegT/DnrJ/EryC1/StrS family aminotransferase [bacterium]